MKHGGQGTLADSFVSLGQLLQRKVIDETQEPRPSEVFWTGRGVVASFEDGWRSRLLSSLEKQTSLKFVQTRRVIAVWIVSEKERK